MNLAVPHHGGQREHSDEQDPDQQECNGFLPVSEFYNEDRAHQSKAHGKDCSVTQTCAEIEHGQAGPDQNQPEPNVLQSFLLIEPNHTYGGCHTQNTALRVGVGEPADVTRTVKISMRLGPGHDCQNLNRKNNQEINHNAVFHGIVAILILFHKGDQTNDRQRHLDHADVVTQIGYHILITGLPARHYVSHADHQQNRSRDEVVPLFAGHIESDQNHHGQNQQAQHQRQRIGHPEFCQPVRQHIHDRLDHKQNKHKKRQFFR